MDYIIAPFPVAASIFLGMLICMEIGRHLGMRKLAEDPEKTISGLSTAGSAVFALYGLLIALTLTGAPSRLDTRRELIAEEANAIGTAYLRLDLLSADAQPTMRDLFRNYVDSRLDVYRKLPDVAAARSELVKSAKLQNIIWAEAVADTRLPGSHPDAGKLLLQALNDMIDITTTRTMAAMIHPPLIIFVLLALLALVCSLLAGYDMAACKQRSWLHVFAFTFIMALSVYAILAIEFPRAGFIRMQAYDQLLIDLRESMQ